MSFSKDVKIEIIENRPLHKHFNKELALGMLSQATSFSTKTISLQIRYKDVAQEFAELLSRLCRGYVDVSLRTDLSNNIYETTVENSEARSFLIKQYQTEFNNVIADESSRYAFLSGAFLACGNIANPEKSYHLEFVTPDDKGFNDLQMIVSEVSDKFKVTDRRGRKIIYSKESEHIRDTLTIMGASKASLKMVDVEMIKNVRNHANRVTNCDTANISKMVTASAQQIEDIQLVIATVGEENLPNNLRETAQIRLENPYASLRELTEMFNPPVSRSGLHHRLTALRNMADEIRHKRSNA